ncbi:MAG: hypothetical protein D6776_10995 [Planctomycetota bacterium]|nr:MAG: hypothetical protein D6776_10995 [Planctomycetota bacterium]
MPWSTTKAFVLLGFERMGDALLASGALRLLREARPELHLVAVTRQASDAVLATAPYLDATVPARGGRGMFGRRIYARRTAAAIAAQLEHAGLDPERATVIALRDRAPYRDLTRRLGAAYLPRDILDPGYHGHHSMRYAQAFEVLGLAAPDAPLPAALTVTLEDLAQARAVSSALPGPPEARVFLHVGASELRLWSEGRSGRVWPAASFAVLADALAMTGSIVIGHAVGAAERWQLGRIERLARPETRIHRLPPLSPRAFAALLRTGGVLVTGDTGPMHLAAAVGARLVALFGPSDPAATGPVSPPSRCAVLAPDEPGPCRIPVPRVAAAVRRLAAAAGTGS